MSAPATFEHFERELNRLVEQFGRHLAVYKGATYDEANVRKDFLDPFFRALGWDMDNRAGLIPNEREVEIESRTTIDGRQKRADYLFRADRRARFVCEAKKPAEELDFRYAFQAKRYAWNKGLPLAVLTDFEELKIYVVGGRPYRDQPEAGQWKVWHFRQFPLVARELWELLSREAVAGGHLDRLIESLPKKPASRSITSRRISRPSIGGSARRTPSRWTNDMRGTEAGTNPFHSPACPAPSGRRSVSGFAFPGLHPGLLHCGLSALP